MPSPTPPSTGLVLPHAPAVTVSSSSPVDDLVSSRPPAAV
jgi:hypothetical protein